MSITKVQRRTDATGRVVLETQEIRVRFETNVLGTVLQGEVIFDESEVKGQPAIDDACVRDLLKQWIRDEISVEVIDYQTHVDDDDAS